MCCAGRSDFSFADLLRDPLIQLVMRSDGVTKEDMIALEDRLRSALTARAMAADGAGRAPSVAAIVRTR
jgi:hypothetical protein